MTTSSLFITVRRSDGLRQIFGQMGRGGGTSSVAKDDHLAVLVPGLDHLGGEESHRFDLDPPQSLLAAVEVTVQFSTQRIQIESAGARISG